MVALRSLVAAILLGAAAPALAQAPAPYQATPDLVEAVREEDKATWRS